MPAQYQMQALAAPSLDNQLHHRMNQLELEIMKLKASDAQVLHAPAPADRGLSLSGSALAFASHTDLSKAYNDLAKAHAELWQKYGDAEFA